MNCSQVVHCSELVGLWAVECSVAGYTVAVVVVATGQVVDKFAVGFDLVFYCRGHFQIVHLVNEEIF